MINSIWSSFTAWIAGLTVKEFDLLKLVIDKCALALLFVIIGIIAAMLLEHYKWKLNREQEVVKSTLPLFAELMIDAEALYRKGDAAALELSRSYSEFVSWIAEVLKSPLVIEDKKMNEPVRRDMAMMSIIRTPSFNNKFDAFFEGGEDALEEFHSSKKRSGFTLFDLLIQSTNSKNVLETIMSDEIWENAGLNRNLTGFFPGLHSALSQMPRMENMIEYSLQEVFMLSNQPVRTEYLLAVRDFRLKMMRVMEARTRRQRRAFERTSAALKYAEDSIRNFPRYEVKFAPSDVDIDMRASMSRAYGAIITQLKLFIRDGR